MIPFTIDNQRHLLVDALNELLASIEGKPFDVATAYFAISGYREVRDRLHKVGAFRLLIGSDPQTGSDIARTERSALAPEAQPLQDLLDRMIYRMAGLTDAEANALEDRLEMML